MARTKIDVGGGSFLPICTACGWRGLPETDHGGALREARHHELRAHPGDKDTLRAMNNHRARHAG